MYVLGEYVCRKDYQVALHVIPAATITYSIQESNHIAPTHEHCLLTRYISSADNHSSAAAAFFVALSVASAFNQAPSLKPALAISVFTMGTAPS